MQRMAFLMTLVLLIAGAVGLAGCTLSIGSDDTRVVTATLSGTFALPHQAETRPIDMLNTSDTSPTRPPDVIPFPAATFELPPIASPEQAQPVAAIPSVTPTDPLAPATETPVLPPTLPPTRTSAGPPTVLPLDDGSGNLIAGTGDDPLAFTPVKGVEALPESLYYLSDQAGMLQVWRLPYGLNSPEQLTFSPSGVAAFDVAPNGTLAYLTPNGEMVIGGVPFAPPAGPDGSPPQATSLAWSPAGDWLAYTLHSPGAEQTAAGAHAVDGLWVRNGDGLTFLLEPNITFDGNNTDAVRVYTGPIDWRPDGTEVLVGHDLSAGRGYSRINIVSGAMPVWNTTALPPDAYLTAHWSVNGNAIITSGAEQVLSVEPNTLDIQTLVGPDAGLWMEDAQQFANGTLTFLGSPPNPGLTGPATGPLRLYLLPPGQSTPMAVTGSLTDQGTVDFLWDNFEQQALIVVYQPADAALGTPYLYDEAGAPHDLIPLTGPVGSPQWGPLFKPGDTARVHTTSGDTLNLRSDPGGQVLAQLANGTRVTVMGGPRPADGYQWWRIKTTDGIEGWAVESVTDERGLRLRTLLPAG